MHPKKDKTPVELLPGFCFCYSFASMKNYLVATPWWLRLLYHDLNWRLPVQGKKVFLTFDDGPTPEITEWTLEQLDKYEAKATFFLIGKNIQENPAIFQKLKSSGHSLGNHTHNHLNGWKNDKQNYLQNVALCDKLVSTSLFRPPYGRITKGQAAAILKSHKVIMWSILSGDFDTNIRCGKLLSKCSEKRKTRSHYRFS